MQNRDTSRRSWKAEDQAHATGAHEVIEDRQHLGLNGDIQRAGWLIRDQKVVGLGIPVTMAIITR